MKIRIQLLSDLCTGSGETYNSMIDSDITYDEYGIPYIPARRIKGCIREAALEMMELGLIKEQEYYEIFGRAGNQNSAFTLSNAYISDYKKVRRTLKQCAWKELTTPQNVLNQYTSVRTQTAVDLETGVAEKNSLRTIRVIKKGLVLEAECNWNKTVPVPEILEQAVSLVKHMGIARTRGLGLVNMELENTDAESKERVLFSKEDLYDKNRISYTVYLKSPLVCKSSQGNQAVTQDYIAGSKILGMIAGAMKKEEYQEMMTGTHEVMISNGYIQNEGKRCVPAPISLQKEKDQTYDNNGEMKVKDLLLMKLADELRDRQMTPANIHYIDENGTVMDVETEISYHHQRPQNKATGRATGKDGSAFYQLAAISAEQCFGGYIYADKRQAEQITDAVKQLKNIRMGYGRSSEFGEVDFVLETVNPVISKTEICHDAELTLISDVLLYNEMGMITTEIRVLENALKEITGTDDLDLICKNPFLRFETVGGYNVQWQRRKPVLYVLGKGSTMWLHSEKGFDIEKINGTFIGERVSEGFGEVKAMRIPDTSDVTVRKRKMTIEIGETCKISDSELLQQLLQTEFERRIQQEVRNLLGKKKPYYKKNHNGWNAAVSKLRVMFKNEKSYEDMKMQADGIEKEEKSNLCKELLAIIDPAKLEQSVTDEMKQQYTAEFECQWSQEELFRNTYKAYIAELKYFGKELEKEDEKQ